MNLSKAEAFGLDSDYTLEEDPFKERPYSWSLEVLNVSLERFRQLFSEDDMAKNPILERINEVIETKITQIQTAVGGLFKTYETHMGDVSEMNRAFDLFLADLKKKGWFTHLMHRKDIPPTVIASYSSMTDQTEENLGDQEEESEQNENSGEQKSAEIQTKKSPHSDMKAVSQRTERRKLIEKMQYSLFVMRRAAYDCFVELYRVLDAIIPHWQAAQKKKTWILPSFASPMNAGTENPSITLADVISISNEEAAIEKKIKKARKKHPELPTMEQRMEKRLDELRQKREADETKKEEQMEELHRKRQEDYEKRKAAGEDVEEPPKPGELSKEQKFNNSVYDQVDAILHAVNLVREAIERLLNDIEEGKATPSMILYKPSKIVVFYHNYKFVLFLMLFVFTMMWIANKGQK